MINDLDIVQWEYLLSPEFELINSAGKPLTGGWIEVYLHGTRDKYYCASDFSGTLHPFKIPLDSIGLGPFPECLILPIHCFHEVIGIRDQCSHIIANHVVTTL